jgi:hypothetical protein
MNPRRILFTVLGVFLFVSGLAMNLLLSGSLLWGEMEARLYTQRSEGQSLKIQCPLMIAPWETATISTVITNSLTDKDTKPQVNAYISSAEGTREESTTLELAPLESQPLQWTVDRSDVVFSRLILVNILQRPYDDLASRQGACSILMFSLFGLSGNQTLVSFVTAGVFGALLGAGLLFYLHPPLTDFRKNAVKMNAVFLCLVLMGLFTALLRLWGLTLFFDSVALILLTVIITETVLFPQK